MRLRLTDVAREAGVSSATVDRVLHNRAGVRARTREIVLETAARLGYISNESASPFAHERHVNLDFILPAGTNPFIADLLGFIREHGAYHPNIDVRIQSIEGFNPDTLANALYDLIGKTQGVGIMAIDHPTVREAVRALVAEGIHVATLVSDIANVPRTAYIGIDNRAAGRLAGHLLGRFLGRGAKGKVAIFAGSLSYRGHEEREMGFRNIIADEFPKLEIVELREMRDDREKAFEEATGLLERHKDLAGIYNIGAGNQGIARALENQGRAGDVIFISHDLTSHHRQLLLNNTIDAVIDQNPRVEAREAVSTLTNAVRGYPNVQHLPRLQVIFRENIPDT